MKYRIILIAILAFNFHFLQAQVGIGTISPTSTLSVDGSFSTKLDLLFVSTTLDDTHHTVSGNNITITLPSPNSIVGRVYAIKAGNSGNLIVSPSGADQIDGDNSSITLDAYETLKVQAVGSGFWIKVIESSSGVEDGDAWGVTGEDLSSPIYRSGDVGIGTSGSPNSTLQVNGSFSLPIKSGNTAYTLLETDYTYITDAADVTLPSAVGREGRIYVVKNSSTATDVYLYPIFGETINGLDKVHIHKEEGVKVQSDGTTWWAISEKKVHAIIWGE